MTMKKTTKTGKNEKYIRKVQEDSVVGIKNKRISVTSLCMVN